MTFNDQDVLREALAEFISARKCELDNPDADKRCIGEYVEARYESHNESFRILKRTTVLTRVQTARNLLKQVNDGNLTSKAPSANDELGIIETSDVVAKFKNDQETKDAVFARVLEYFKEYECFQGESIHQSDDPIIYAPNVLSDIADDILQFEVKYKDE